jgi:hypothetical protein
MQQAFARVGINGYGARQVGRQLHPRPPPDPSIPPENKGIGSTRERVLEAVAAIAAMSPGELDIEILALEENTEAIKVELRGVQVEPSLHEVGWQRRAERALAGIKTRLALCVRERERRKSEERAAQAARDAAAKADRLANHERLLAEHRAMAEAKRALLDAKEAADAAAFVRQAQKMLPHDTVVAIWTAVNAQRDAALEGAQ